MIKTIIIDDEQHCIDAILKLTSNFHNMFKIIGTFTNVDSAVAATPDLDPDLVFLDIEIKNKTGFNYLEELGSINFNVVFTTAYDKYAVKAFKFSALSYLLKPIDIDEFKEVVNKIEKEEFSKSLEKKMAALMHNFIVRDQEKRIIINSNNDCTVIEVSDILYCKSTINYTDIYTINKERITSTKTLKYYDDLLSDSNFYRIDQSFLINIKYVKKYTKGKPAYVILIDGVKLKVSLKNKEGFHKALNSLYRE